MITWYGQNLFSKAFKLTQPNNSSVKILQVMLEWSVHTYCCVTRERIHVIIILRVANQSIKSVTDKVWLLYLSTGTNSYNAQIISIVHIMLFLYKSSWLANKHFYFIKIITSLHIWHFVNIFLRKHWPITQKKNKRPDQQWSMLQSPIVLTKNTC